MWECVYTSAGVFARAHTYACMSIVRVHAYMCRVRMHACTLCGRMLVCDSVHVRSVGARAHVCMCGCVCARVCACMRVHARVYVCVHCVPGCMRVCARAPVCVVCMVMRVLVWVRAHESVSALMRECACMCVWAYADMCIYKIHKHIKAARVVSKKQHRRQEAATCRFYIYISLSFLSPSSFPFSFMVSSYLCII